jgi:hypothetical protein
MAIVSMRIYLISAKAQSCKVFVIKAFNLKPETRKPETQDTIN